MSNLMVEQILPFILGKTSVQSDNSQTNVKKFPDSDSV
jgi:hypothetical protein